MKKLLSTSAFLGALALTAGSAEAANLQVNVGGFIDFQAGYTQDSRINEENGASTGNNNANRIDFNTDTEVHFTVEGVADNGLEYGAVIELEADVGNTDRLQNGGLNADKAYLFGQGAWGRVELGDNTDSAQALGVNSGTFASGTGGVNGDFYRYVGIVNEATPNTYIIRPELPLASAGSNSAATGGVAGAGADEDATKITYYSPRIAGFQVGASYIPNSQAVGYTPADNNGFENAVTGGINYTTQYDQFAIKLAATGEHADAKGQGALVTTAGHNSDLNAWNAGANVSFAGFTVGGSYGNNGKVIADTDGELQDVSGSHYWDAGVGYAFGPWSASASYFESSVNPLGHDNNAKFNNLVVGTDYKLAPGLVPYAEVSLFDAKSDNIATAPHDNGTAVIVGTQLTF